MSLKIVLHAAVLLFYFFARTQCEVKLAYVLDDDKISVETSPCSPNASVSTYTFTAPAEGMTYVDAAVDDRTGHIYLTGKEFNATLRRFDVHVLRIEIDASGIVKTFAVNATSHLEYRPFYIEFTGLAISKKDNLLFYSLDSEVYSMPLNFTNGFLGGVLVGRLPLRVTDLDMDEDNNYLYARVGIGYLYRGNLSNLNQTVWNSTEFDFSPESALLETNLLGAPGMKVDTENQYVFGIKAGLFSNGQDAFHKDFWGAKENDTKHFKTVNERLIHVAPDLKNHMAYYTLAEPFIKRITLGVDNSPENAIIKTCRNVSATGQPSVIMTWIPNITVPCANTLIPGDFNAIHAGTIVVKRGGLLSISGCASFSGDLVLVLENSPDGPEFFEDVANYSCLVANSIFKSVSVQDLERPDCEYSVEPIYTAKKMSIYVRRKRCGRDPLETWHFVAVGMAALTMIGGVVTVVALALSRERHLSRTLSKLETHYQTHGQVASRPNPFYVKNTK